MSSDGSKRRPLTGGPAVICALLDALALRLDLAAAAGRHPLLRTPLAIGARSLSMFLAFWFTSWVGTFLGLSWVVRTFRAGKKAQTPAEVMLAQGTRWIEKKVPR